MNWRVRSVSLYSGFSRLLCGGKVFRQIYYDLCCLMKALSSWRSANHKLSGWKWIMWNLPQFDPGQRIFQWLGFTITPFFWYCTFISVFNIYIIMYNYVYHVVGNTWLFGYVDWWNNLLIVWWTNHV